MHTHTHMHRHSHAHTVQHVVAAVSVLAQCFDLEDGEQVPLFL